MKILITGGHLTPALAVIDKLKAQCQEKNLPLLIYWVGRKYALEKEKTISIEYQTIITKGLPFFDLPAGKISRDFSFQTIINIFKIPFGFLAARKIINSTSPDIILSFGGYLALPICLLARLKRIPIITHEQTLIPGLANKIIARISNIICLSWNETSMLQYSSKIIYTGNPLRKEIFNSTESLDIKIPSEAKLIYITGGNLGSHFLNQIIFKCLLDLLNSYYIIHQTGESSIYPDFTEAVKCKNELPPDFKNKYFPYKYIHEKQIGWVLNKADLVIGRSGANTISELLALGKPCLLIPLPWSGGQEQLANAQYVSKKGLGEVLEQKNLTPQKLLKLIDQIFNNYQKYISKGQQEKKVFLKSADDHIAKLIIDLHEKN